jgi:hypothetical protein
MSARRRTSRRYSLRFSHSVFGEKAMVSRIAEVASRYCCRDVTVADIHPPTDNHHRTPSGAGNGMHMRRTPQKT